ncbi:prepilin peptidase [Sedimentibacter sp.]|uniref:prepilin peptidase n=1 Tax=Sedimentibacter sp. TaxID=1960295 RepID=UPI0028A78478|nr:prepilin peptidase [Sedimentibacter sp.]
MKLFLSIIIGIAGLIIGYKIPEFFQRIMQYKKGKHYTGIGKESFNIVMLLCLLTGLIWGYSFYQMHNMLYAAMLAVLMTLGLIIAYIDVKIRIIPNELVLVILILGIAFQITYFGFKALMGAAISMIVMMVVFTAVAGFVGFGKVGAGDVKLAGVMGISLGYPLIITAIGIMAVVLTVFILSGMALKKIYLSTMLPFAPFMITGYISALLTLV